MSDPLPGTPAPLLDSLRGLTDDELVTRLKGLAARERRATALLVAHLAELDTRDVHLRAGYSSLFAYCRDVLALSEHEALNRIEAARTARRFPVVLDLLAAGDVNLTAIRLLGPHLDAENHRAVLEFARGKRKAEVEEIVARLSPRPDVRASVRRLPEPVSGTASGDAVDVAMVPVLRGAMAQTAGPAVTASAPLASSPAPQPTIVLPVPSPRHSAEVRPLSPDRYRYQLTIGGQTLEKLRFAKDLLRHALPTGDDEAILDRALTALLKEVARQKFGSSDGVPSSGADAESSHEDGDTSAGDGGTSGSAATPSGRTAAPDSRHVPAAIKRAVWVRDLGGCAFVGAEGRRCGERAFVEFHHLRPFAMGGEPTVGNLQLRCRRHNDYEARLYFARATVGSRDCGHAVARASSPGDGGDRRGRSGTSARVRIGSTATVTGRRPGSSVRLSLSS